MNKLLVVFTALILFFGVTLCNAGPVIKSTAFHEGSEMFSSPQSKKKKAKVRKPMSVVKAQRKQAAKEEKLKRDSEKYIKENRKRSIEIQTPEVQERMKQNIRNADSRYKAKKKNTATRTRKAGRKYR